MQTERNHPDYSDITNEWIRSELYWDTMDDVNWDYILDYLASCEATLQSPAGTLQMISPVRRAVLETAIAEMRSFLAEHNRSAL